MAFSMDSTIKEILDSPEAVAVVEKYSPGFSKNPQLKMALGMKIGMAARFPQAKLSKDQIAAMEADLKNLA